MNDQSVSFEKLINFHRKIYNLEIEKKTKNPATLCKSPDTSQKYYMTQKVRHIDYPYHIAGMLAS